MQKSLSTTLKTGSGNVDAFIILAVLIVITLVGANKSFKASGGLLGQKSNTSTTTSPTTTTNNTGKNTGTTNTAISSSPTSSYTSSIYINNGNASYAYQPYEEYITLGNRGKESIDITGWQIKNGKSSRAYDTGGNIRYLPSDTATIPRGAQFISPTGNNVLQNIVLKPGETAIITTGTATPQSPYRIVSFKENICTGYLENMPDYNFTPRLSSSCPRPADEVGLSGLDNECRQFVERRLSSCRTPEFDTRDSQGEICHNCVDGRRLSNSCIAFIKSHFSYNGCIANHSSDPNFSLRTWRIFLGQGWEMWAKDFETIEIFDQLGRLVKRQTY